VFLTSTQLLSGGKSLQAALGRRRGFGRKLLALFAGVGFVWAGLSPSGAADLPPKEYQIKAAFLYNFTKFVDWPDSSFADASSPIIIGVLGANPFDGELAKVVEGRKVNGRPLVVKQLGDIQEATGVHVLFMGRTEDQKVAERLATLKGKPILTVGESESFAKGGGMIKFLLEGDKVRFEINVDSADEAGLKISAQLQKLARTVRRKS